VVKTVGSCGEHIGGVIMVHSVAESRNCNDQGSRTVNLRDRADATATNVIIAEKGDIASIRTGTYNIRNGCAGTWRGLMDSI
jgi:hypothetical protein